MQQATVSLPRCRPKEWSLLSGAAPLLLHACHGRLSLHAGPLHSHEGCRHVALGGAFLCFPVHGSTQHPCDFDHSELKPPETRAASNNITHMSICAYSRHVHCVCLQRLSALLACSTGRANFDLFFNSTKTLVSGMSSKSAAP